MACAELGGRLDRSGGAVGAQGYEVSRFSATELPKRKHLESLGLPS